MSHDESPQQALPGMDHLGVQFAPAKQARVKKPTRAVLDSRAGQQWSGPIPGQTVMGTNAHNMLDTGSGHAATPFQTDRHGFVGEKYGEMSDYAQDYYGTHGGAHAKGAKEILSADGLNAGQVKQYVADNPTQIREHTEKVDIVNRHWDAQPLHQVRADTPVHTGQSTEETTGIHNGRKRVDKIRGSLEGGQEMQKPAWLMKSQGRLYSLDGHHRVLAAREAGLTHYPAKVWDLDQHEPARALRSSRLYREPADAWASAQSKARR